MNFHGKSKRDRHGRRKKQRDEIEYMAKRALSASKKLKRQSVIGYSNDSNPFGIPT